MTVIRAVAIGGAAIMAIAIAIAFVTGDFGDEGATILDLAWGRVTLIDIYVGIALFSAFVVWREGAARSIPWIVAFVVLGNLATALYVAMAALRAEDVSDLLRRRA